MSDASGPAGDGSYSYTLSNITTGHTITASFAALTHIVNVTQAAMARSLPLGPLDGPRRREPHLHDHRGGPLPRRRDSGSTAISVKGAVTGPAGDGSYSYTLSNITTAHTITASFASTPTSST